MSTEATAPPAPPSSRSAVDLLLNRYERSPAHVAFARRTDTGWREVTIGDFVEECRGIARGLIRHGVGVGDRVVVRSPTRYEWAVADFAVWLAGGVVVPVYDTASRQQIAAILDQTAPACALAGSTDDEAALSTVDPALPVWTMDSGDHDLAALAAYGQDVGEAELDRRKSTLSPDSLATIVYTSGTSGKQKGVRISHGNLVSVVAGVIQGYPDLVNDRGVTIILLPLAHILARGLQLVAVAAGMKVIHESDRSRAIATFAEVQPTFLVVVPQLLTRIRAAARSRADAARLAPLWRAAERTAVDWSRHLEAAQDDPSARPAVGLALRHRAFDLLFYRKLRAQLGGRVEWLLSGAAPLDETLARFFWGAGIGVIQGYGLTETTAPATGQRPGDIRPGGVGTPIAGTSVRIANDGEVLVRGGGVFAGYADPDDDNGAFLDGFFRTGDLGSVDGYGRLTLHGRVKNLIVTASGKNVAPEPWENTVARSPLVAHALMVGERRSYLTGLIVLEPDAVRAWADRSGHPDLHLPSTAGAIRTVDHPALRDRLDRTVARANAAVSRAEQVREYRMVVADLTPSSALVTPTLKLRREALADAASDLIEQMYPDAP